MRLAWLSFVAACGSAPLHVAVDLVTPIPASEIASINFEVVSLQGKSLIKKTVTSSKGVLENVNFAPPAGVPVATLHASLFDENRALLGVGQTRIDFTAHGKGQATLFAGKPTAPSFSAHPRPSKQHRFHSGVATTPDGKIWIVGGVDENNALITAIESYDPYSLTFTTGITLDYACLDPTIAVTTFSSDDVLVIAGGANATGETCPWIQTYDTTTGAKGTLTPMPKPLRANGFALTLAAAKAVIFGGSGEADAPTTALGVSIGVEPPLQVKNTQVTTATITLTPPRRYGVAFFIGSNAYLAGDGPEISQFDLTTGAQTTVGLFDATVQRPTPATYVAGAQGVYVLAGGSTEIERWQLPVNPTGSTVTAATPVGVMASNRTMPEAVEIAGPQLVISGGLDADLQPLKDVTFYDLEGNTTTVAHVVPRAGHRLILTATNTLLVIGGSASDPTSELYSLP